MDRDLIQIQKNVIARATERAKIETIYSMVKRKLSSRAPGRSLRSQIRQALLLGLTYNLYRLRRSTRMSTEPVLSPFRINT